MTLRREGNERFDGRLNLVDHPVCGTMVVFGGEFPNSVEVDFSFRVKFVSFHWCWARRAALLARSRVNTSLPGIGLTRPLFRSA